VKRKDVIREIKALDAVFVREGAGHSVYRNPRTGMNLTVPRHKELNEHTAQSILDEARK